MNIRSIFLLCLLFLPGWALAETSLHVVSDSGDYIGQGRTYDYDLFNATFSANPTSTGVSFRVESFDGQEYWTISFSAGRGKTLEVGTYEGAIRYPFNDDAPGFSFSGTGRGCNKLGAHFTIVDLQYGQEGEIESFNAEFTQHCENRSEALTGTLQFNLAEGLPETSLEMEGSDYIGQGKVWSYDDANATFSPSVFSDLKGLRVSLRGDDGSNWNLSFDATADGPLAAGSYLEAKRYPFNNLAPGISVTGNGRGCNKINGSFDVLQAEYEAGELKHFGARFEQYCDNSKTPLTGTLKINYTGTASVHTLTCEDELRLVAELEGKNSLLQEEIENLQQKVAELEQLLAQARSEAGRWKQWFYYLYDYLLKLQTELQECQYKNTGSY